MNPNDPNNEPACPSTLGHDVSGDLAWLLNRAAQIFRTVGNEAAEKRGLEGMRDYLVLNSLTYEPRCTQAELGQRLHVDKTTLMAVLDRLERAELVIRRIDPENRRARFPEVTEAGRALQKQIDTDRVALEAKLLAEMSAEEQKTLRHLLNQLIRTSDQEGKQRSGSCM